MTALVAVPCRHIEWRISMRFDGTNWTDVSRDVLESYGIQWDRGISGSGPNDRVASAGALTFSLNNSHVNSNRLLGHYSPSHVSRRLGWDLGVLVMLEIAYLGNWRTEWVGRVSDIEPEHGALGPRLVRVTAKDWMEEAATHKLKALPTLDNVRADDVMAEIVAAMVIQPPSGTEFDTGVDVYPLAFDDVRDGKTTAMTEFAKLARSGLDYIFLTRDGVLRYQNRNGRIAGTESVATLVGTMQGMTVRRSRDAVVNRIEVTVHPRAVDDNLAVLWSLQDSPLVGAGQTVEFRADYVDPESPGERIGAIDIQPLAAGSDYRMSATSTETDVLPDRVATLSPDGQGTYSTWELGAGSTKPTAVADDDDGTYSRPTANGGLSAETYTFENITDSVDTARVASLKLVFRIRHTNGGSVFYPRARLNGIDLDLTSAVDLFETATAGVHEVERELPRPGGGEWTIADVNALEVGGRFNWTSEPPQLTKIQLRAAYVGATVVDNDRTSDFDVVADSGGNASLISVTNNGTSGSHVMRLAVRGRPVRQYEPVVAIVEDAASIAAFGERTDTVDMSYQADVNVGATACQYLLDRYSSAIDRPDSVAFLGNLSAEHMNAALDREIGDRIGISEEVTGLSLFTEEGDPLGYHIQGIAGEIMPGPVVAVTWKLAPADPTRYWRVGVEGVSEVGETTIVAPM